MWENTKEVLKWVGFLVVASIVWVVMAVAMVATNSHIPFIVSFMFLFPMMEEWFKSNHSNTKIKAHLFGILEFLSVVILMLTLDNSQFTNSEKIAAIVAKSMSTVMHWATGMFYYKAQYFSKNIQKKIFWECVVFHSIFNACIFMGKITTFRFEIFVPYLMLYCSAWAWKKEIE